MRHRRAAPLLLSLLLSCSPARSVEAPASVATPQRRVLPIGLCEDYPEESTSLARVRDDMNQLRALGVTKLRISLPWDSIEPEKGRYDWSFWDRFFAIAVDEYGMQLLPYVAYTPAWAVRPGAREPWHEPPLDPGDFERFLRTLASRYASRVDSWEIWNEPDNPAYWSGSVDGFAELVHRGAAALRAADPSARVVLGGIAWNSGLLRELFAQHAIARDVDVVNIHSYAETWSGDRLESLPAYVARVRRIVRENGEDEPIWVAEIGYSSYRQGRRVSDDYRAAFDYEHTPRFQAVALLRMLTLLRATDEVSLVAWYELRDLAAGSAAIGDENNRHLGIFTPDGHAKPARAALAFARRLFEQPLRVADADISLLRIAAGGNPDLSAVPVELHAFEHNDRSLFVVAWIPTAAESTAARGRDDRRAALQLRLPHRSTEARLFDELGRETARVQVVEAGSESYLPLVLRAGEIVVAEIAGSGGEAGDGGLHGQAAGLPPQQ